MNLPILHLESSRATIVPTPERVNTVPTWNPHSAATNAVAGNMVSTCWKPNKIIWPMGGISLGKYPITLLLAIAVPEFTVFLLDLAIVLLLSLLLLMDLCIRG